MGLADRWRQHELRLARERATSTLARLQKASESEDVLAERGRAYLKLGRAQRTLGHYLAASDAFDTAYETLKKVPRLQGLAVHARVQTLVALAALGRLEEVITASAELAEWEIDLPDFPWEMPLGLWLGVAALLELGRDKEVVLHGQTLVDLYAPGSEEYGRQIVAWALMAISEASQRLGDEAGATHAASRVWKEYRFDARPQTQAVVAKAILMLGRCLEREGRRGLAGKAYARVTDMFGSSQSPDLRAAVSEAERRRKLLTNVD
jgi:tetratricopeptide (TPR) repeat protein